MPFDKNRVIASSGANAMFMFVSPLFLRGSARRNLSSQPLASKRTTFLSPRTAHAVPRSVRKTPAVVSPSASQAWRDDTSPYDDGSDSTWRDWQEDFRLLLDPTLNTSARQVLVQDLAKRVPSAMTDMLKSPCVIRGTRGLSDVARQFTDDVLPDLLANGPRYAASVANAAVGVGTGGGGGGMPGGSQGNGGNGPSPPSFTPPSLDLEDVGREFRNVFNRTPEGLFTPDFRVLFSTEGFEIRKYPSLIVAETTMRSDMKSTTTEVESASAMGQSFNNLAGYLFGKNASSKEMKMTTPVMLSKGTAEVEKETMSFIIGEYASLDDVPGVLNESITLREEPGKIYAVCEFSGFVTQGEASRQREKLLQLLASDNIQVTEEGKQCYKCMIYNGPSTLPNLRRNELMIEVVYNNSNNNDNDNNSDQTREGATNENTNAAGSTGTPDAPETKQGPTTTPLY